MNKHQPASILVVDDVPENLQFLVELMREQGHKVYAAPTGERALASVRETPPDLMLLDVRMPGMDGYEVCRRMKADKGTEDIPILFISGLRDLEDKIKGFTAGGADYIIKPFQAEEVLVRVNMHLSLRRTRQQLRLELARRRQSEEALREANVSKDKFFAIIAHDLRSPLTTFLGMTDLLVENFSDYDDVKKFGLLKNLHAAAKNVHALLNNLLDWSRLERGLIVCHPVMLRFPMIIERTLHFVKTAAQQKQIRLRNLVPSHVTAYADEYMVQTILRNLLVNAIKFTQSGGSVEISALVHQHEIELTIADTGIGMSQETIATLFRIDLKESRPGTEGEKGTGLGLILCKELAEKMGGCIRVESHVGQGSRFTISLPAHA